MLARCAKIKPLKLIRKLKMKFQADREVLSDAVSFLVRMLSPRPQLPQLSGVVVDATDGSITLSIFDYEVVARVSIAGSVEKPGKTLVQARLLAEIVSKLRVIQFRLSWLNPGLRSTPGVASSHFLL
jgi:DNA polymerase-3 subunit beta